MEEIRRGRQTPTTSITIPYTETRGADAIDLYHKTGRTAQEWQELLCYDILAVNDDGLWTHTKCGYSVPRRNGKNEIIVMREMFGLANGEKILHTAHRATTCHSAWERLCDMLTLAGYEYESLRAFGRERIDLADGGRIEFRTRTQKGGLGEGFDTLVIDEAQEYQADQESALKYVVSDSANPQTIYTGTPPTPVSSGTVFLEFRKACLAGDVKNAMWAEWAVDHETDVHNVDAWYETNPSLGAHLKERAVEDEISSDTLDFNIQRLGFWVQYNQKSAISEKEWGKIKCPTLPKLTSKLRIAVKFARDGASVSVSIAAKTDDGRVFIEAIDCQNTRDGIQWIVDFIRKTAHSTAKVVIDGAAGEEALVSALKAEKLKAPYLMTVRDVIAANASFEPKIQAKAICHMGQPSLTQAVTNSEHRAIGSNGGYGYKSLKDAIDVTLIDSAIMAVWACGEFPDEPKKQKVSY